MLACAVKKLRARSRLDRACAIHACMRHHTGFEVRLKYKKGTLTSTQNVVILCAIMHRMHHNAYFLSQRETCIS